MTRCRKKFFAFKPGLNLHLKADGQSAVEQHQLIYKHMACFGASFPVIAIHTWLLNRLVLRFGQGT